MFKPFFFITLFTLSSTVFSAEQTLLQQKIDTAMLTFETTPRHQWAFQVTRFENEEGNVTSSIERFDPTEQAATQWSLIQLNGQSPTDKQKRAFQKDKAQQKANKGKQGSFSIVLRELVNIDSLKLVSENNAHQHIAFDVTLSQLSKQANAKLTGLLYYNHVEHFIERIEITNQEAFSPVFSAKITDLTLNLHFIKRDGSVLPIQNEMVMKGSFAFFTKIDEVSKDTYSEYRFIPSAANESHLN